MTRILFRRADRAGGHAYVNGHLVEMLQIHLERKGFGVGKIDGIFGSDTETAVRAWQSESGRPTSGSISVDEWTDLTDESGPDIFDLCLQITAAFEGHGFRKAVGNFDDAWLTWGVIGFTLKHKEIQEIIKAADAMDPAIVSEAFGPLADELRDVIGKSATQQERWADQISVGQNKYAIEPAWRDAFSRFGAEPRVQALQVERARDKYWTRAERDSTSLGLSSDLGRALCFDIAVQNGGVSDEEARIFRERVTHRGIFTAAGRREILAEIIADTSKARWRQDVFSRKHTLATGEGTVHGAKFTTADWGLAETAVEPVVAVAPRPIVPVTAPSFQSFFDSLGLKHFKASEFLCLGDAHTDSGSPAFGLNEAPPADLWNNIVPTAKVLDELRSRLDAPIILNSVYRSPAYNAAVGGVANSQHVAFCAADFVVRSASAPSDWAAVLKQMRTQGLFRGGIGVYNTFVHIDTRGENADW